jgi:hypothetical protein
MAKPKPDPTAPAAPVQTELVPPLDIFPARDRRLAVLTIEIQADSADALMRAFKRASSRLVLGVTEWTEDSDTVNGSAHLDVLES